ncbi:MAG: hypothetical protein GPOALKHO_000219 [Sodalis sp.]|nr:MAG: hypothetical protein GPOALKHO_000219 [Sodalis sp.]
MWRVLPVAENLLLKQMAFLFGRAGIGHLARINAFAHRRDCAFDICLPDHGTPIRWK